MDYLQFRDHARRRRPRVALILGSGLGHLADRLADACAVPFAALPGLDAASVPGHRGELLLGDWAGRPVLLFAGRLHFYEGHTWERVLRPVHIAHELGAETLIATNAAGGIRAELGPGELMPIRDHVECTRPYCWRTEARPGPYSPRLTELLCDTARGLGANVSPGVYAQLSGPSYETPAEIQALAKWGADAVGMSTAREVQTGFDLGMECVGLSCITNKAAGLSAGPINHEEVLAAGAAQRERIGRLLEAFLAALA